MLQWLSPLYLTGLLFGAACIWMLYEYLRRKKSRVPACTVGCTSGVVLLILLHFYGDAFGISLPLTVGTIGAAAVCGIPGVLLLCLLERCV